MIQKILIVGGGTAGWLSACFLQTHLNKIRPGRYSITLIESKDIGIIGVGEATVPTILGTLKMLGISETEFMQKCNATFKHAIKFVDWLNEPNSENNFYYHAFERPQRFNGYDLIHYWKALNQDFDPSSFAYAVSPQAALCDSNCVPKLPNSKPFEAPVGYAYHMDAVLFGKMLRERSLSLGVERVVDTITTVDRNDSGHIEAVNTASGKRLEADLFIDCSGFKGLLINEALNTEFISYEDQLFCDRAVTIQVPLSTSEEIRPYTTSTALSNGWVWEIHLQDRKGIGYVYSSKYISDQDAEKELRDYIGKDCNNLDARFLKMRVGRNKEMWNKNVVSIGLSAGFLEPLESSGIYLVEMGLRLLADFFPHHGITSAVQERFNTHIGGLYDEVMQFIVLHYCLTNREDSEFWKANKFHGNIPEELQKDLDMWQYRMPTPFDRGGYLNFFNHETFHYILAGMNRLPDTAQSIFSKEMLEASKKRFGQIRETSVKAVNLSPNHKEYLKKYQR